MSKNAKRHIKKKKNPNNIEQFYEPMNEYGMGEHRTQRYVKNVKPRSVGQKKLMDAIDQYGVSIASGMAGTGKTYLAVAKAVEYYEAGKVDRIILSRPAIESGESLGYLPGDLIEKMAPYLRPLYDALNERLGAKRVKMMMQSGEVEIAPIAYMRGRTLNNAFVVIDEAQNCTYAQIKMILSRLGWHSKMVVTGDPDQSDLLEGISGLAQVTEKMRSLDGIGIVDLGEADIVRHPLVADMLGVL